MILHQLSKDVLVEEPQKTKKKPPKEPTEDGPPKEKNVKIEEIGRAHVLLTDLLDLKVYNIT